MKVMTILGTRPEIIRLCLIIQKLDRHCQQVLVHTGQNFDRNLNDIFMQDLGVRAPDYYMSAKGGFGEQMGIILTEAERIMTAEKPDKFLVLGDTNSSLAAIMAKRLGIPVYHMEAGNRCHDDRVPEEVNRCIIDHCSDVLLPYTQNSKANLLREGIPNHRVLVTGNPIYEVIEHFEPQIRASRILETLGLEKGGYFLVTMHRAENVDIESRLLSFVESLHILERTYQIPVIVSTHPRTRLRMEKFQVVVDNPRIRFLEPFGFFDFITLEREARCVLSDSGTVQEECAIFRVPSVTLRDVTERPETLEAGSNMLTGADAQGIVSMVNLVLSEGVDWTPPPEYLEKHVSRTIAKIVLGHHHAC